MVRAGLRVYTERRKASARWRLHCSWSARSRVSAWIATFLLASWLRAPILGHKARTANLEVSRKLEIAPSSVQGLLSAGRTNMTLHLYHCHFGFQDLGVPLAVTEGKPHMPRMLVLKIKIPHPV